MIRIIPIAVLLTITFCTSPLHAETAQDIPVNKSRHLLLNGELIAAEISKATGCAISPILGISVLGAYTYYTTAIEDRDRVPWFAKPVFWGPLLVVLLGIILKDSSKIALPKIIIMPLDAIETLLEKNTSAVLGLLVILSSITGKGVEQLQLAGYMDNFSLLTTAYASENLGNAAATASSGIIELSVLSFLVTLVFGLVWVVSQSFNFLMLLCPFSWLDLLLAMLKNSVIALLLGAYLVTPFLGLFVSCLIILISIYMFARSLRFVIFGTIVSGDLLFKGSRKHTIESDMVKAFAGSTLNDVPPLTYGSLSAKDSLLTFHYRPWLMMPKKTVAVAYRCNQCEIGIGTLSPVIICEGENFKTHMVLFRLRPLYNSHEQRVAQLFGLNGVRDVTIGKTLKDSFRWLKDQLGFGRKTPSEAS